VDRGWEEDYWNARIGEGRQRTEMFGGGGLKRPRRNSWRTEVESGQGLKLTTHLHEAPTLRVSGVIPLLPSCVRSWRGQGQLFILLLKAVKE
jgi:hypothetical protein